MNFLETADRYVIPGKSRVVRVVLPSYIIIHATRGETAPSRQNAATINWFKAGGGDHYPAFYGPSADILIGNLGEVSVFTTSADADFRKTRANWSAGYGASITGTYGADEHGISIEVAQSAQQEHFSGNAMRALTTVVADLCVEYQIPAGRLLRLSQDRSQPIPRGIVGHEDTAHGERSGKSDPGEKFPWPEFIQDVSTSMRSSRIERDVVLVIDGPTMMDETTLPPDELDIGSEHDMMRLMLALSGSLGGYQKPLHTDRAGRAVYEIALPKE